MAVHIFKFLKELYEKEPNNLRYCKIQKRICKLKTKYKILQTKRHFILNAGRRCFSLVKYGILFKLLTDVFSIVNVTILNERKI